MQAKRYDIIAATTPNLDPQIGILLAMMDDGTREWQEELGDVSEDQIVWQCAPNLHSIGALLLHIAEVEGWWIQTVCAGKPFELAELAAAGIEIDQYGSRWPAPPPRHQSWYYEILARVRAATREAVSGLDPSSMRTFGSSKNEYSVLWILTHVLNHEAYHGGQAVLLKALQATEHSNQ